MVDLDRLDPGSSERRRDQVSDAGGALVSARGRYRWSMAVVEELVGVYDADGGLLGEAAYVVGRLRGTRHCALCDITHSAVRRRPAWDAMVARLPMPFTLLHLNEMPDDVAARVREAGAPVVLARSAQDLQALLTADDLEKTAGDVAGFEQVLRLRLADM